MAEIAIKPIRALEAMRAIVELQKTYWGYDLEAVIPSHMLYSLANYGGHVLVAYDGDQPVGLLVGFLGTSEDDSKRPAMANLQIVSKRLLVLPSYRGQGIALRLKLAQRDIALTQGVRLVTWTFNPLLAVNAHLNIRKLGGVASAYLHDYYGTDTINGLATLGSSDRLLVEWWVTHRRVDERLHGKRGDLTLAQYREANTPLLNPTTITSDGAVLPSSRILEPDQSLALIEIPTGYAALVKGNPVLAQRWQAHTREAFDKVVRYGFMVTDFLRESYEGRDRAFYVLSYNGPQVETGIMN